MRLHNSSASKKNAIETAGARTRPIAGLVVAPEVVLPAAVVAAEVAVTSGMEMRPTRVAEN